MAISIDQFKDQSFAYKAIFDGNQTFYKPYKALLEKIDHVLSKQAQKPATFDPSALIQRSINSISSTENSILSGLEKKIVGLVASYKSETVPQFEKYVQEAYRIYLASSSSSLHLKVLGSALLRGDELLLDNFGTLHKPNTRPGASTIEGISSQELHSCGIIHFNSWNILNNDAAILGAIHDNQTIYLSIRMDEIFTMTDEEIYKEGNLRVMIRELLQLQSAGYAIVISSPCNSDHLLEGAVLMSTDPEKTKQMTMQDVLSVTKNICSASDARQLLAAFPKVPYEQAFSPCVAS